VIQGVLYALFLAAMTLVGVRAELGVYYFVSVGVAAGLVAYEFWLCRNRERDACFKAFLHNNWVGAALFVGIALALAVR
jgi:4-hydroxybenzoate polyprenyltransferase